MLLELSDKSVAGSCRAEMLKMQKTQFLHFPHAEKFFLHVEIFTCRFPTLTLRAPPLTMLAENAETCSNPVLHFLHADKLFVHQVQILHFQHSAYAESFEMMKKHKYAEGAAFNTFGIFGICRKC